MKWARRDLSTLEATLKLVRGRKAVVQAGGNLGIFPKALAASFETVYTFEPDPELFAALMHNAPEPNIVKLQAAAGLMRAPIRVERKRRDGSNKKVHEGITHVAGAGTIPTIRIDDLGLPACDLIYLDVEGWELFALQGAIKTIERCRPVIAVEVNSGINFAGSTPEELRAFILCRGYRKSFGMHSDEIYVPYEWL